VASASVSHRSFAGWTARLSADLLFLHPHDIAWPRNAAGRQVWYGARAWKGHDWNVLDRLHAKGYISDPRSKAKSVVVTEEGVKQSRAFFAKYFGKKLAEDQE